MKKGFTIVEIIISISIILIVGISTTFFVFNKKTNNELNSITKEILEAANSYVKIEKDKSGNTYANEIVSGAKGVQIPLSNLVNAGYIKEEQANVIYDNYEDLENSNTQDYYVLFVQEIGGANESYCNENEITSYASWMPKGENIYLCDILSNDSTTNFIEHLKNVYGGDNSIPIEDNYATYEEYDTISHRSGEGTQFILLNNKRNGLYKTSNNNYYYSGVVSNNYVNFMNRIFRIVSFENNIVKLITENAITFSAGDVNFCSENYSQTSRFKDEGSQLNCLVGNWYGTMQMEMFDSIGSSDSSVIFANIDFKEKYSSDGNNYGYYGLLTEEETFYAGVYYDNRNLDGYNYVFNDSYLSSGNSFLLLGDYSSANVPFISNDDFRKNIVHYQDKARYIEDNNYDFVLTSNYIRPVIALNTDYINFNGLGTISNPYVLTFKDV